MKLSNIYTSNDPLINESFKEIHGDIDRIFQWLKELRDDKELSASSKQKVDYIKKRLESIEKEVPKNNLDLAKKVLTGIITFPLKALSSPKLK